MEILQTLNNADKANKRHIVRLIETWQSTFVTTSVTTLLQESPHSAAADVKKTHIQNSDQPSDMIDMIFG